MEKTPFSFTTDKTHYERQTGNFTIKTKRGKSVTSITIQSIKNVELLKK